MTHTEIQENIHGLLEKAGFGGSSVTVVFDEKTNTLWFSVDSSDARFLLNRDAEALSAINHIATKMVERMAREDDNRPRIVVDANNHQRKKIENLRTVAHMMAERARYFKSSIDVDPMPAHERRIVHEFLSEMPDIKTESIGEGKDRHIVIRFIDKI